MDRSNRKPPSTTAITAVDKTKPPRTEESRIAKRESDRVRGKTRINIGRAFERWRQYREMRGFKSDPEMAFFLLDRACSEHLSQDTSSAPPRKRGRPPKSTAPLQTVATQRDSPQPRPDCHSDHCQPRPDQSDSESQPSPDPQSTNVEVLGLCYDNLPPIQPHQSSKLKQPELQTKDGSDHDIMIGSTADSCGLAPQSLSSSTTTEEDNAMHWEEIKDELALTAQRLQEHLDAMRAFSVGASETVSTTGGKADQKEVNKSNLMGLFKTCHQCGEPVLKFKTLTSGSLIRVQWECSKGHLMWLFPNYNPT